MEIMPRLRWPALLVLPLVVAAVFWSSLDAPFVFDDLSAIVENPHVRTLWPLSESLSAPPQTSVSGRPVVAFSLALNHAISGMSPRGFRLGNLLIHCASALLLFALVRRTLRTPRCGRRFVELGGRLALAAAALWAVHPLNTEAVVYVIQRTELLCGVFVLGTLYASIRGGERDASPLWSPLAVVLCLLAVGSKEVGVVAPLLVLLWDAVFGAGTPGAALARRPRLYGGLFASWLPLAYLVASGGRSDSVGFHHGIDPLTYLLTQSTVVLHYLRLSVVPSELHVTYDWPLVSDPLRVVGHVAALAGAAFLTLIGLMRRHPLGFVGAAVFVCLLPTSSVVPIVTEIVAERRMYLPLAALVPAVVVCGWMVASMLGSQYAAQLLVAVCIVLAGFTSTLRLEDWKDAESLFACDVAAQPGNDLALNNLALVLADKGRLDEADALLERALVLRPDYPPYLTNSARLRRDEGRLDESIALYERARSLRPGDAEIVKQLALTWMRMGRPDEAERCFADVVRLCPEDPTAHWNLAGVFWEGGRTELALREVETVVRLDPSHAGARDFLARMPAAR